MPYPLDGTSRAPHALALLVTRLRFGRPTAQSSRPGRALDPAGAVGDEAAGADPDLDPDLESESGAPEAGTPESGAPGDSRLAQVMRAVGAGPALVLMALGLVPMALAVDGSRGGTSTPTDQALWLLGLAVIFLPAAVAATWPGLRGSTRLVLAVSMAVLLQVGQVVLPSGSLLSPGSSARSFPGLAAAVDAVQRLTGLSDRGGAVVVLVAVRLVLALAVLLMMTRLTGSVRVGAGALVVYACHPQMVGLDARLAPEAFALPLAVLAVYLLFQRRERHRLSWVPASLTAIAVASTDVGTSAALVLVLAGWSVSEELVGRRDRTGAPALVAVVTVLAAAVVQLDPGGRLRIDLGVAGSAITRSAARPWESVLLIASIVLTVVVLVPALWRARRLLEVRMGLVVVLVALAVLYPLAFLDLGSGFVAETGDHAAGFVFLGVGFVVAWWLWQHRVRWWLALAVSVGATAVFLGGVVQGAGSVGDQLTSASPVSDSPRDAGDRTNEGRRADADTATAAEWMRGNLPAGSTVLGARTAGLPTSAYGGLKVVDRIGSGTDAARLVLAPAITSSERAALRDRDVRYLVADRRGLAGSRAIPRDAVLTFSTVAGADVVYDDGSITVVDLGRALGGRR